MRAYVLRNRLLTELGYTSYRQYLRSKLWKSIRDRKLARDKNCYVCDLPADSVHHSQYTMENLKGESLKFLYSVCRKCHYRAEFTRKGVKRTPAAATQVMQALRKRRLRPRKVPDKPHVFRRKLPAESL